MNDVDVVSVSGAGLKSVRRALLSVTDKTGLVAFATELARLGVDLISTGGTAKALRDAGLAVRDISELTGFPEMLDGRVKTLHPKVHGGILHRREEPSHVAAVTEHAIEPIDMVVVNLYAFEKTAAKNFNDVAVVTSAGDYAALAAEMRANSGALSLATRWRLAQAAFATTAAYDAAIANVLDGLAGPAAVDVVGDAASARVVALPKTLRIVMPQRAGLRYGENPHQAAALYSDGSGQGIANAEQLQGKELSYNNLVDLDACWALVSEFDVTVPAVCIIKHTNPCGVGLGASVVEAYQRALAADPVSAFGGVIGVNATVDAAAAGEMAKLFVEAIVAPEFTPEALAVLAAKKNLRVLRMQPAGRQRVVKQISGGFLVQDEDHALVTAETVRCVTARQPTGEELQAMLFAWKVCKHVKSNAIVYARLEGGFGQSVGVGAGQMSRVDAARFGAMKAALSLVGTVAASDAFFPFPDGLERIAEAGATAVIQPGGSVKDADVVAAADRLGVAMVMTGVRHFRHG